LRLGLESKEHHPHCGVHLFASLSGEYTVLAENYTSEARLLARSQAT